MKIHFLILTILLSFGAKAQHSLVMTRPLEFNGGLAGNAGYDRLSFNTHSIGFNNITQTNPTSYQSYNSSISYDWLSTKLKGGIGLNLIYNSEYSERINSESIELIDTLDNGYKSQIESFFTNSKRKVKTTGAGFTYSPKFIFKNTIAFSPFISSSFIREIKSLNYSRIESQNTISSSKRHYYQSNFQAGFLVNKEKWYAGYKLVNIRESKLGINHNFQFGYMYKRKETSKFGTGIDLVMSPWGLIDKPHSNYSKWSLFGKFISDVRLFRLHFKYENFSAGIGIMYDPVYDDIGLAFIGYKFKNYKFSLATLPVNFNNTNQNKHEIGFQYIFKKDEEKDKLFSVPLRN